MSIKDIIDSEYLKEHGWLPYKDEEVINGLGLWDVDYYSNKRYTDILVQKRNDGKGYELINLKNDLAPINKESIKTQGDFEHNLMTSLSKYRKKPN